MADRDYDEDSLKGRGFIDKPLSAEEYFHNGLYCEKENSGSRGKSKAYLSFFTAASKHHIGACFKVGEYLLKGISRKADPKMSIQFYREAANGGHLGAIERMIKNASKGVGMSKDLEEARKWAEKGASLGSSVARDYLASLDSDTTTSKEVATGKAQPPVGKPTKQKDPPENHDSKAAKDADDTSFAKSGGGASSVALFVREYLLGDKKTGAKGIAEMLRKNGGEYNERLSSLYAKDAEASGA